MKTPLRLKLPRTAQAQRLLGKRELLVAALHALWNEHETTPAEIDVTFLGDAEMQTLHFEYLNDASSTDIITFDLGLSPEGKRLGALYICPEVAQRFAARYKIPVRKEVHRLLAHGVLHLLGFDDHSPQDKRRMRRAENKFLAQLASA